MLTINLWNLWSFSLLVSFFLYEHHHGIPDRALFSCRHTEIIISSSKFFSLIISIDYSCTLWHPFPWTRSQGCKDIIRRLLLDSSMLLHARCALPAASVIHQSAEAVGFLWGPKTIPHGTDHGCHPLLLSFLISCIRSKSWYVFEIGKTH